MLLILINAIVIRPLCEGLRWIRRNAAVILSSYIVQRICCPLLFIVVASSQFSNRKYHKIEIILRKCQGLVAIYFDLNAVNVIFFFYLFRLTIMTNNSTIATRISTHHLQEVLFVSPYLTLSLSLTSNDEKKFNDKQK